MKQILASLLLASFAFAQGTEQPAQTKPAKDVAAKPSNKTAPPKAKVPAHLAQAEAKMSAERMLERIKKLSSDEFEGRAPGTPGEELTVKFLEEQFRKIGLKPGNPDGTYIQKVPLAGLRSNPTATITAGGKKIDFEFRKNMVAASRRFTEGPVTVNDSDIVFVGYGVVAPEYGWDDYKGLDVKGKTIVMLINDPAVADPNDPSKLDDKMFRGKAMTYYGRWTYKYEIATEKGAAAVIIVHQTGPAGYPWEVVSGSWGAENFDIQRADNNMGRVAVEGWITLDKAKELFTAAGQDFDKLAEAARKKDFKPVPLNAKASFSVTNSIRKIDSRNVIAKLEGSDPKLKNEYVIYSAHWDHLGRDTRLQGDQIFNGALDNASGTAQMLEIAQAFVALSKTKQAPKRSVLFLSVTAEEKGLLGAQYYAANPLYPLQKTLANVNIDGINQWGRTADNVIIGDGNSTLDDLFRKVAARRSKNVKPEPEPEKGFYYRSDHFEFAKQGVPALYPKSGTEFIGKPADFSKTKREAYTNNDYHKPSDQVKPDWELSGAMEDAAMFFETGYEIANGSTWPEWKPGTEFKAKRDQMMNGQTKRAQ